MLALSKSPYKADSRSISTTNQQRKQVESPSPGSIQSQTCTRRRQKGQLLIFNGEVILCGNVSLMRSHSLHFFGLRTYLSGVLFNGLREVKVKKRRKKVKDSIADEIEV